MEKIVNIAALSRGNEAWLVVVTNHGRLFLYTPTSPPTGHGTWMAIDLPPGMSEQMMFEQIETGARVNQGYQIWKDKDHGMFCWKKDGFQSEFFERLEGAIGGARMDYMLKHPPKPPPPKPEHLPAP